MTTDTQAHPLSILSSLGLISDAQRGRALAHVRFDEIAAEADPARHLVWLVLADIVSEETLAHKAAERLLARRQGEVFEERKAVLEQAMKGLAARRRECNRDAVASLCAEGLISVAGRDAAARRLPSERLFGSPAAALAWMVMAGLVERAHFDLLRSRVLAERSAHGASARRQIVEQARLRLNRAQRAQLLTLCRQMLPGSPWLWLAGLLLALGGPLWYALTPAAAPACDADAVTAAVRGMLFQANAAGRADIHPGATAPPGAPALSEVREVGYAADRRLRGCAARLEAQDSRTPYAYTIAPAADDATQFTVSAAEPALVAARFGHIDPDGGFGNQAEPLGREQVARAFRAGVDALRHDAAGARHARMLEQMRRASAVGHGARERLREIADLEPLGACRALKAGTQYTCRLMIERNDPLLAAIGVGSATVLQGDFTFERAAGAAWRVSAAFDEELGQAIAHGRDAALNVGMSRSAALPPQ